MNQSGEISSRMAALPVVAGQLIELSINTNLKAQTIRDEKRNTSLSTFKSKTHLGSSNKSPLKPSDRQIGERNSLESINSKCSISSGGATNEDLSQPQPKQQQQCSDMQPNTQQRSSAPESGTQKASKRSASGGQPAEARSRYVSPPALAPDKDWPERGEQDSASSRGKQLVAMMSAARKDCQDSVNSNSNGNNGDKRPSQVSIQLVSPPASEQHDGNKPPFMFAGIVASLFASVCFSFSTLFIKLLPDSDGFEEKAKALFFRGVSMTIFCSISIIYQGSTFLVPREEIWVNAARAVFGTVGVFGSYCALKYISVGDATAIIFSSPIWTSILSHFILKERIQWIQLFGLPISVFGIVLIAHPALIVSMTQSSNQESHSLAMQYTPHNATTIHHGVQIINSRMSSEPQHSGLSFEDTSAGPDVDQRWPGIVIALLVSLVVSGTYIVLKYRKKTGIQTTTFWLSICVMVSTLIFMSIFGFGEMPANWTEWALLIGNGVVSWLGQSAVQWAFLYETASVLSIMRTMDVALTFTLSSLFLDEDIFWTSILGSTIISLVVVSIVFNNWLGKLTCTNNCKKSQSEKLVINQGTIKSRPDEHLSNKLAVGANAKIGASYVISTSKI